MLFSLHRKAVRTGGRHWANKKHDKHEMTGMMMVRWQFLFVQRPLSARGGAHQLLQSLRRVGQDTNRRGGGVDHLFCTLVVVVGCSLSLVARRAPLWCGARTRSTVCRRRVHACDGLSLPVVVIVVGRVVDAHASVAVVAWRGTLLDQLRVFLFAHVRRIAASAKAHQV